MSKTNQPSPEDTCFCQSYYDDDHKLQDCSCGKCGKPSSFAGDTNVTSKPEETWEDKFDESVKKWTKRDGPYWPDWDKVKQFITQALANERKRAFEKGYEKGKTEPKESCILDCEVCTPKGEKGAVY